MPHPFLGLGFTSPLFSKFIREEEEALLELTTKSDTTSYEIEITSTGGTWTYTIDWGDGNINSYNHGNTGSTKPSHTYSSAGVYEIKIDPVAPTDHLFCNLQSSQDGKITMVDGKGSSYWTSVGGAFDFCSWLESVSSSLDTSNCTSFLGTFYNNGKLNPMPLLDTSSGEDFGFCWTNCYSLQSFPLIDTSSATSFGVAWSGCTGLTGAFPQLDMGEVLNAEQGWYNCNKLTSFPAMNSAKCTDFEASWMNCSGLTSFGQVDTSAGTKFASAWRNCTGLTSFPDLNYGAGTNFINAWRGCTGLTSWGGVDPYEMANGIYFYDAWNGCTNLVNFPANVFYASSAYRFNNAWKDCPNLTPQSIENILVSIDSIMTGTPGNVGLGGTTTPESVWTATALSAKTSLVNKGWTIDSNP